MTMNNVKTTEFDASDIVIRLLLDVLMQNGWWFKNRSWQIFGSGGMGYTWAGGPKGVPLGGYGLAQHGLSERRAKHADHPPFDLDIVNNAPLTNG